MLNVLREVVGHVRVLQVAEALVNSATGRVRAAQMTILLTKRAYN